MKETVWKEGISHPPIHRPIWSCIRRFGNRWNCTYPFFLCNELAQTGRSIPCYGTTHADYFYGEIPCVRCLTKEEINSAYEENTGHLIVSEFKRMKKDVMAVPAVLCKNHGPFSWGKDAKEAVHNAVVLEEVAKMAYRTELIHPQVAPAPQELQDKHYFRKHGANAYYGQN